MGAIGVVELLTLLAMVLIIWAAYRFLRPRYHGGSFKFWGLLDYNSPSAMTRGHQEMIETLSSTAYLRRQVRVS